VGAVGRSQCIVVGSRGGPRSRDARGAALEYLLCRKGDVWEKQRRRHDDTVSLGRWCLDLENAAQVDVCRYISHCAVRIGTRQAPQRCTRQAHGAAAWSPQESRAGESEYIDRKAELASAPGRTQPVPCLSLCDALTNSRHRIRPQGTIGLRYPRVDHGDPIIHICHIAEAETKLGREVSLLGSPEPVPPPPIHGMEIRHDI